MRTLAHLSDLHFGRESATLVDAVVEDVARQAPELVVVSGDLTQRATRSQYRAARDFLSRLPGPRLVVPGNHDISLFHPLRRFLWPLALWRRFIGTELAPFHRDGEIAVLGINTARSFTWKNGRISREQMETVRERLCPLDAGTLKVLATHHPFLPPPRRQKESVVGRAEETLRVLRACDVDVILSGHYHTSHAGGTHRLYRVPGCSILAVQAGTATSVRTRAERNSYNVLTIDGPRVRVGVRQWNGERFATRTSVSYERVDGRWTALSEAAQREVDAEESAPAEPELAGRTSSEGS